MFQTKFNILTVFTIVLLLHVIAGVYFNGYSFWWVAVIVGVYLLLLILGSTFIRWNFYLKSRNKLPLLQVRFGEKGFSVAQNNKAIALTFDDGPSAQTTKVLDILKKEKVPATFFLIGKNIEGNEAIVARMAKEGHEIGGHSFHHSRNFDWQNSKDMLKEIESTNAAIESVTGKKIRLFRPPYGVTNPNLAKAVRNAEMVSVGWNIRSLDTIAHSPQKLLQKITQKLKPGAIILLHDHCLITTEILPALIAFGKEKGFKFVTI